MKTSFDRRTFMKMGLGAAASAFTLGFRLPVEGAQDATSFQPNIFLTIHADGRIQLINHRSEMGQGARTSLPMLVAEELEVPVDRIEQIQGQGKQVVENWLTTRPDDDYFELGRSVLVRLAHKRRGLGREFKPETVDNIVEFCSIVAEAAGGVFGLFWQTSGDERAAIRQIANHISELHATQAPSHGIVGRTITSEWQNILDQFKTAEFDLSPAAKKELFGD